MSSRYMNALIMAPMVRAGTLPNRLLALRYGADIVYGEEIIDHKMLKSKRVVNAQLGTVDFVLPDGEIVFRTCSEEKNHVIFQMGTSCPERAVKVASMVESDVSGIDVNMGCPKEFSVKGGMGAALMSTPDIAVAIMEALVANVKNITVSCKTRIMKNDEDTLVFCRRLAETGIAALGLHGRLQSERPRNKYHPDIIRKIASDLSIPVIANGASDDITSHASMEAARDLCGSLSIMVARAAMENPSVFRKEGPLPTIEIVTEFVKVSIETNNAFSNSKYCLNRIMAAGNIDSNVQARISAANNNATLCSILGLDKWFTETNLRIFGKGDCDNEKRSAAIDSLENVKTLFWNTLPSNSTLHWDICCPASLLEDAQNDESIHPESKRRRTDENDDTYKGELLCSDLSGFRLKLPKNMAEAPKTKLFSIAQSAKIEKPHFVTTLTADRRYICHVTFSVASGIERTFSISNSHGNKRTAETASAIVALYSLGIYNEEDINNILQSPFQ